MIEQKLNKNAKIINDELKRILKGIQENGTPVNLIKAMKYATINGGAKRIRPFVMRETAKMIGMKKNKINNVVNAACAVEFAHCYSLVHDDLPAMDDDKIRRGKPTVHVMFGEDTAILTGDALLTLAFQVICDVRTHKNPNIRTNLTKKFAHSIGPQGMVGGQILDMETNKKIFSTAKIKKMQEMKTARLIQFSAEAAAIINEAKPAVTKRISEFGKLTGLMFQITDDLIDINEQKQTLVSALGVKKAKILLEEMNQKIQKILKPFGKNANTLIQLNEFIMTRKK